MAEESGPRIAATGGLAFSLLVIAESIAIEERSISLLIGVGAACAALPLGAVMWTIPESFSLRSELSRARRAPFVLLFIVLLAIEVCAVVWHIEPWLVPIPVIVSAILKFADST